MGFEPRICGVRGNAKRLYFVPQIVQLRKSENSPKLFTTYLVSWPIMATDNLRLKSSKLTPSVFKYGSNSDSLGFFSFFSQCKD